MHTAESLRKELKAKVISVGLRPYARQMSVVYPVDPSVLGRFVKGHTAEPPPCILNAMGLEIAYRKRKLTC